MREKVLISTGGSGGHVIPAITIHDHLKEKYDTIISTDSRGLKYLEKNVYRYKLENFNDDWVDNGTSRNITFQGLGKLYFLKYRYRPNHH